MNDGHIDDAHPEKNHGDENYSPNWEGKMLPLVKFCGHVVHNFDQFWLPGPNEVDKVEVMDAGTGS